MSMISTGLTGLLAAQRGLEATSNNVANAGTDGYVRRRTLQAEALTAGAGVAADVGSGVRVSGIQRLFDAFLTDSLRGAVSSEGRAQTLADMTTRLDALLGNPELGIGSSIQGFFDQVEALGREPTSASIRQQVLSQGESLSQRFQQLGAQLDLLGNEVRRRSEDAVSRINTIADSLARINESLGKGVASSNDLLDQRDALLAELSGLLDTAVVAQPDGTTTVLVGNGQPLVVGIRSARLSATPDQLDPSRQEINLTFGGTSQAIGRQISSGTLGGLLSFRAGHLETARRDLNLIAASLGHAFNQQHADGLDAYGNLGGDFFVPSQPQVAVSAGNAGTASVAATIADATELQARDYELRYTGSAWQLADASTGATVAMSGSGTLADPFRFDGLSVTVSAGAAANDRFLIRPVADAAARFAVAVTDAGAIAAAAPVRVARSLANASDATVALAGIADSANPALRQPVQIRFSSPTTFRIYDAGNNDLSGPLAYTSGADIGFNGWTVRISGTVATGDRFDVLPTPPGSADNGNARSLATVARRGLLNGGQVSVDDLAARLVASVGSSALRNTQDLEVQSALREQVQTDLDGVSGVNLDEEAANLLRYQQAYQAASKTIAIGDELFRTLLELVR